MLMMPDRSAAAVDIAACRAILRQGSRSFFAASLLLPRRFRAPASALYAFCRLADDAADGPAEGHGTASFAQRQAALALMHERLEQAYAGHPADHPVDRAFARTVQAHAIPRAIPDALFEGFAWDMAGRQPEGLADLEAYATRVAGTVGLMLSLVMGRREPAVLARAADLGIAMQFTNIARDVGEDARAGRLYLPRRWLLEEGIDPAAFLANPVHDRRLARVVARLLAVADGLYARAIPGIAALPADARPAIHAARLIYGEIGRDIARHRHDAVSRRAVSTRARKFALLGVACLHATRPSALTAAPPVGAAQALISAVAASPALRPVHPIGMREKAAWTIDLFARLEAADRASRLRPPTPVVGANGMVMS